ncbi:pre-mRNA processing RNA-helicase [Xylographa soralifera]|nr:pre-mRNA processing RNA-helicase [Xylographa soralifera]
MKEEVTDTEVVLEVQRDATETEIPIDTATGHRTSARMTTTVPAGETNHVIEGDPEIETPRDTSREYDRRRRDGSTDSKRNGRRRYSREKVMSVDKGRGKIETIKTAGPAGHSEEEKKAERLAKLEAWKQKQKLAAEKQKELQGASGAPSILDEIDRKAAVSPTISSPTAASSLAAASPLTPDDIPTGAASPTPYAGKFDPKAIARKAANSSTGVTKLGTDIALPELAKASGPSNSAHIALKANKSLALAKPTSSNTPVAPLKARGNLSGFGITPKAAADPENKANKRAIDFEDDEGSRKKLEKLPTPPLENGVLDEDNALANYDKEEDDEEDVDMQDAGTEEETAAAARAAAEKREERLQAQNLAYQAGEAVDGMANSTETTDDIIMSEPVNGSAVEADVEMEEEEEADPLDTFMTELGDPMTALNPTNSLKIKKKQAPEPEAMFGDEDVDLKTMDADPDDILAMASKRKKKDLPATNHAKMSYESFTKSFYNEPSELIEMTEEEVADLRLELDGIKIRGIDAPKPVQKWSQCGLGVQTMEVIEKLGYDKPSAIQSQAIPSIMSGRDVIGVAKTGSGKTIAFLLPMFRHIKDQRSLDTLDGPVGLIMTPTRELATQIHKECKPFLKALSLRAVCAYGGAPIKEQIADLKRGAEIIVCTPGRIIDLLAANSGRVTNLRRVTYVVLDEADRMFDMGFEPQVMKILANIRPDRQTVLFSATFPRQMEALARKTLAKPIEIVVGGRSVVAPEITQVVEVRAEESKFIRLLELLGNLYEHDHNEDDRALIFVDRQESADGLLKDLMRKGYPCMSIHGGKDQIDRDSTIDDFKAGVVPIMIATSVAARGLDVKQLKLVVNYDAPNHLEDYVHRAGRTGRAGNTGTAVTFITEDQERYSLDIAKALRQSGQDVPEELQKLVDRFIEKVKSGKEKVSGSGFGGKGLERLDQERDAARNRERKTYKTGEEGEDDDKEENKKDKDDDLVAKAASTVQSASAPAPLVGVPKGIDLDGKITVHKTEAPIGGASKNPLDKVSRAVANIHERLNNTGVLRQGVPIDNKGPDAGAFHATLEINDFPRKFSPIRASYDLQTDYHAEKARWAVTNRTNVAKILEATGTSITTKGSFYATGKEPQAGENPKLYILVEGDTEVVVTNAMRELMRLLKEGTIAAADSDARAPASGRYNVV